MNRLRASMLAFVVALATTLATNTLTPYALHTLLPTYNAGWSTLSIAAIGSSELMVGAGSSTLSGTGPTYTPYTAFTPTSNFTNTTHTGVICQTGNVAHVMIHMVMTGTPASVTLAIDPPAGYMVDRQVFDALAAANPIVGVAYFSDSGVSTRATGTVRYNGTVANTFGIVAVTTSPNTATAVTQAVPFTYGTNDLIDVVFSFPVQ